MARTFVKANPDKIEFNGTRPIRAYGRRDARRVVLSRRGEPDHDDLRGRERGIGRRLSIRIGLQ